MAYPRASQPNANPRRRLGFGRHSRRPRVGALPLDGLDALALGGDGEAVDVRLFGKPVTRKQRRMGVAPARADDVEKARALASEAARRIRIVYS